MGDITAIKRHLRIARSASRQAVAVCRNEFHSPELRATEASTTIFLLTGPGSLEFLFRGCQISMLGFQADIAKILRPIPESTPFVNICAGYAGSSLFIASEPVELDIPWAQFLFRYQGLDAKQKQRTVGFNHDLYSSF